MLGIALVSAPTGCQFVEQLLEPKCVLEESNGQQAIPADLIPRAIDPADRVVSPEVRAYLDGERAKLEIFATTVTRRGSMYDWIDPRSQVPDGVLAEPPPLDPEPDQSVSDDGCRPKAARGELEDEPEAWGPPGTVPILRIDPDRIHAPGTVADFLSKYGDASDIPDYDIPAQVSPTNHHFHARARISQKNFGGEGYFSIWQPFAQAPQEMSLGQIGVFAVDESGNIKESVEAGWIVYQRRYGDFATRFFVYFTTTGYKETGPNKGGPDEKQLGWVQTSSTIRPGTILTETSALGGEPVEAYIRVELHEGKWWVRFRDEFVGYYPASMYSPTGLGTQATGIQFNGETYDDPAIAGMTVTDMGSGEFPNLKAKRRSAYMRDLQVQDTFDASKRTTFRPPQNDVQATNRKCYSFIDATAATDAWHSQFYYGGPGQNPGCP